MFCKEDKYANFLFRPTVKISQLPTSFPQVTSILSKLAQLPHPYLHEYLLNPTVPLAPGARSLFTVMTGVLRRAKEATAGMTQLQRKIYVCRKTLLGSSEADRAAAISLSPADTRIIDGLIVLEEFSKEIAAIALVKYHHAC